MEGYRHIVCATDFSEPSRRAAARAADMAERWGARLTLLYVVEYFPEDRSNRDIAPEDVDPETYQRERGEARLGELAAELGRPEAAKEVFLSPRSAKHEIVELAAQWQADLVVLASHGHYGITALMGSTATGVVQRAPCDVLAVRAG